MKQIVIVGGGLSGIAVALELERQNFSGRVTLIERGLLGAGMAYAPIDAALVLNVRVDQMGVSDQNVAGFHQWLKAQGETPLSTALVPRQRYGEYLRSQLASAASVTILQDEVLEITPHRVKLRSGGTIDCDHVVLATGHDASTRPNFEDLLDWPVVHLLGTGLSMVDVVLFLERRGYQGKIHAYSRHGRLPRAHDFTPGPRPEAPPPLASPVELVGWVKQHLASFPWRGVVDSIRPVTQNIWRYWSARQRAQFLRHLRSLWDVHRHRMGPEQAMILESLQRQGQLTVHAIGHRAFQVPGPSVDCRAPRLDLVLLKGEVPACDADGVVNAHLSLVGPLTRDSLWENVAVPDIRQQAKRLAHRLQRL